MGNCLGKTPPKGSIPLDDANKSTVTTTTTAPTTTATANTTPASTTTTTAATPASTTTTTTTTTTTATTASITSTTTTASTITTTTTAPTAGTTTTAPTVTAAASASSTAPLTTQSTMAKIQAVTNATSILIDGSSGVTLEEKKKEPKIRPKREYTTIKSNHPVEPRPMLMVSVISATVKSLTKRDPYIKFFLRDGTKQIGKPLLTTVVTQSSEPTWPGEVIQNFGFTPGSVIAGKTLVAELWDKDKFFDDFIGVVTIPLGVDGQGKESKGTPGIADNVSTLVKLPFRKRPGKPGSEESKKLVDPDETGSLTCTVHFKSVDTLLKERPPPKLKIFGLKGHSLMNTDMIGQSDPYVIMKIVKPAPKSIEPTLSMRPVATATANGGAEKKTSDGKTPPPPPPLPGISTIKVKPPPKDTILFIRRTRIIENSLNPVWAEECFEDFRFLPGNTLLGLRLEMEVWDQDDITKDDFMGKCTLDFGGQIGANSNKIYKEPLAPREGKGTKERVTSGVLEFQIEYTESQANSTPFSPTPFSATYSLVPSNRNMPALPYLSIVEMKCSNLLAADRNGMSDPYVRVDLMDGERVAWAAHTRYLPKTLNPEFEDELVDFGLTRGTSLLGKKLHIQVFDHDLTSDDFLGEIWVELGKEIVDGKESYLCCPLMPRTNQATGAILDKSIKGEIFFTIRFESSQFVAARRLPPVFKLFSFKAAGLSDVDILSKSDPYLRVKLAGPDKKTHFKYTSHECSNTLTPDWQAFACEFWNIAPGHRLVDYTCTIQVYDKDTFSRDDFLGELVFDFAMNMNTKKIRDETKEQKVHTLYSNKEAQKLDLALLPRVGHKEQVFGKLSFTVQYFEHEWSGDGLLPPPVLSTGAPADSRGLPLPEFAKVAGSYVYSEDPSLTAKVDEWGIFSSEKLRLQYKLQYYVTTWEERLLCLPVNKKLSSLHQGDMYGKNNGGHVFDPSLSGGLLDVKEGEKKVVLNKVNVFYSEKLLAGIELLYSNSSALKIGCCDVKTNGNLQLFCLELKEGEALTRVGLRSSVVIEAITFYTTEGRVTKTFGNKMGGEAVEINMLNNEILSFYGSYTATSIDSLGAIFRELPVTHAGHSQVHGLELRASARVGIEQNNNRGFDLSKANIFCPKPMVGAQMALPELVVGMIPPVVSTITTYATDEQVCGINVEYSNSQSAVCGGNAGGNVNTFRVMNGEYISAVHIRADHYIEAIQVVLNTGRKSVWAGGGGGGVNREPLKLLAPPGFEIIGFHGTFSELSVGKFSRLDTLGVIFRSVEITRPLVTTNALTGRKSMAGNEYFTVFRVANGTVNVLALQHADTHNGFWTRIGTKGLQVDPKFGTVNLPVCDTQIWYPEKFQPAVDPAKLQPWVEARNYALVRTTAWQVKQYSACYLLKHSGNPQDEHRWNLFFALPPLTTRARDYRMKITAGGTELPPKVIACREQMRFGEKALVIPYVARSSEDLKLELTLEWSETGNQLVVTAAAGPGAKVDPVDEAALYRGAILAPQDNLRFTASNAIYSWDSDEVKTFVQDKISRPGDHRTRAIDIARRVMQYIAANVLLADERDDNELKRMGPYAQHPNFPQLIMLLRAETGNAAEHGILFVGLMRACGIPARRLRVLASRGVASRGWAEYFCPNVGWVPVRTTDKTVYVERAVGDFLEQPDLVTGFEDGYTVDLKLSKESPPKFARVPLDAVFALPLQNGFQSSKLQDGITTIAAYTLPAQIFNQPETEWFKESNYGPNDVLTVPPAIYVPTPPSGAISADNLALTTAFDKADHVENCLAWFNLVKTGQFQEALDMFVPAEANEVRMKARKRQERLAKEGKDDSKANNHPLVLYLAETFVEVGLEHIAQSWPGKNEIEIPPKANCRVTPILNVGNHAVEVSIGAKVNGTQVLFKFEFVHSRGARIFDLLITFNHEYLNAGAVGGDNKRDR